MNARRTRNALLTMVAAGAASLALPCAALAQSETAPATGAQPEHEVELEMVETSAEMAEVEDLAGKKALDFTLTDTEGKEHTLSTYLNEGKIVVLEWFNPQCPLVVRHHEKESTTMTDRAEKYAEQGVVWLAINSGSDRSGSAEANEKAREKWEMGYPVLLDETGDVGKTYGSKNTPTMYVIGKDGVIAYAGGIDNNPRGREEEVVNYVEAALDALLAGSNVETAYAEPYGCNVKYREN